MKRLLWRIAGRIWVRRAYRATRRGQLGDVSDHRSRAEKFFRLLKGAQR